MKNNSHPLSRHQKTLNMMQEFSIPLLMGLALALMWANADHEGYYRLMHGRFVGPLSLHFISNDIFMAFFFGIAAVEVTQSCLPGGELHPIRKAVSPLLATLGGVLGPVTAYLVLNYFFGSKELLRGWGIPTATDIALAWLAARMVFGERHPAVTFLLLIAIADDAIGMAIIAIFYSDPSQAAQPQWLLLTAAGVTAALTLREYRVTSYWPYLFIGGALSWTGLILAHLHPALALVFVIPLLPHGRHEDGGFFRFREGERSTLSSFEHDWRIPVDFGLFLFGLANGGVRFSSIGTVTWLVLASICLGKVTGIFTAAMLGERLGYDLPPKVGKRELLVISLAAGIGLTVALFMAGEAFEEPRVQGAAKMGAVLSALLAPITVIAGRVLGVGKFGRP